MSHMKLINGPNGQHWLLQPVWPKIPPPGTCSFIGLDHRHSQGVLEQSSIKMFLVYKHRFKMGICVKMSSSNVGEGVFSIMPARARPPAHTCPNFITWERQEGTNVLPYVLGIRRLIPCLSVSALFSPV